MKDLDTLLATDPDFLLGNFLAGARAAAGNDAELAQFQYDQRSILSTWSDKDSDLHDYANRELSGLVSGLYTVRWNAYFTSLSDALEKPSLILPVSPIAIDWFSMENAWARKIEAPTTKPVGDAFALAQKIMDKIALEPN
jgi:alpha-N-acetylglucosaminidase